MFYGLMTGLFVWVSLRTMFYGLMTGVFVCVSLAEVQNHCSCGHCSKTLLMVSCQKGSCVICEQNGLPWVYC